MQSTVATMNKWDSNNKNEIQSTHILVAESWTIPLIQFHNEIQPHGSLWIHGSRTHCNAIWYMWWLTITADQPSFCPRRHPSKMWPKQAEPAKRPLFTVIFRQDLVDSSWFMMVDDFQWWFIMLDNDYWWLITWIMMVWWFTMCSKGL